MPDAFGTYNSQYWASSAWSWINAYNPGHFIDLVHDVPTTGLTTMQIQTETQDILSRAVSHNAAGVYATDGLFSGNTWGQLPASSTMWDVDLSTGGAHDFPGTPDESYTSSCPSPAESPKDNTNERRSSRTSPEALPNTVDLPSRTQASSIMTVRSPVFAQYTDSASTVPAVG